MMISNNENFMRFLQDGNERHYAERVNDYKYRLFKIPYDGDCDFIHVLDTYVYKGNEKPGLNDTSALGGIYVYSLGLLFNAGYELRGFVSAGYKTPDTKEYYGQLKKDVAAEVTRRVETGLFDRDGAERLVGESDRDIEYYKEYREYDSARQAFLEGKRFDKPEIRIYYDTQCDCDVAAVLEYLRSPAEAVNVRADAFMETEKAMIYKRIVCAETRFRSFKEIEADKSNPLRYQREIRRVMKEACVKTVNVTFERNGHGVTVKTEAERLGYGDSASDWYVVSADRHQYREIFGYKTGGDAKMDEIMLITHGKKELYSKSAFEKTLRQ
ncbi:hypothetical protein FACS1894211_08840 [Clostridia bacterium]|nr:hypothetical protein FACS1894211_08840 [Clostridia bacterium]